MSEDDEKRIAALEIQLLGSRDHAIGMEATAARLRIERDQIRARLQRVRAERDALAAELAAVRASTTWRVGHFLVAPVARLRRR